SSPLFPAQISPSRTSFGNPLVNQLGQGIIDPPLEMNLVPSQIARHPSSLTDTTHPVGSVSPSHRLANSMSINSFFLILSRQNQQLQWFSQLDSGPRSVP